MGERLRAQGHSEGDTLPRDMSRLGNYYMMCYMPALSHQDPKYKRCITIIRYEDLVTNPALVIDTIHRASGLKFEEFNTESEWQHNEIDYEDLERKKNAWLSELWGKKISSSRIGTYRETLTQEEIGILEKICAGPLTTFGYL
ncbi:MAG TPA: hypothetical protein ENI62_03360 [Gammaproteobacteria bacterium]|nr:hypothetical protein [Gammaproteobacteria bacterium]